MFVGYLKNPCIEDEKNANAEIKLREYICIEGDSKVNRLENNID